MSPQNSLYRRAYRLLNKTTPLPIDCGSLCGRRCCHGDASKGMWLLPGEEEYLRSIGAGEQFAFLAGEGNQGCSTLVCNGHCSRSLRPFACRIFPLFPMVTTQPGRPLRLTLQYDPRSLAVCPIAAKGLGVTVSFRQHLRQATRLLLQDPEITAYLLQTTTFLEEINQLSALLLR